jgi:hypothetical protein
VDGNFITEKPSTAEKTAATGPDPPSPVIVAGLNTRNVFEGECDSRLVLRGYDECLQWLSMTSVLDAFFGGDYHSSNETLFKEVREQLHQLTIP